MTVVRQFVVIDASPEDVWRIVADPRNLPRWNRYIRSVSKVPDRDLQVGDRYATTLGALGITFQIDALVEELDPPRFARVRLTGPIDAVVRTWVRPIGSGRARLEHEVDYHLRGGPLGEAIARGLKLAGAPALLKRGIRAQKRQAEAG